MLTIVYGSLPDDTYEVATSLANNIKVINLNSLMKYLSKKCKYVHHQLCLNSALAINTLKAFENTYGSVIVSGNLFLTEKILEELSNNPQNTIIITVRDSLVGEDGELLQSIKDEYGFMDNDKAIKYYCGFMYRRLYDRLYSSKHRKAEVFLAENGEVDYDAIDHVMLQSEDTKGDGVSPEYVIYETILNYKEVLNMPNEIADAIKECMTRLGYNPDVVPVTGATDVDNVIPTPKTKPHQPKTEETPQPEEQDVSNTAPSNEAVVLCKCKDGKMVLFLPHELKMKTVNLSEGEAFDTITIETPDLNTSALQVLDLYGNEYTEPKVQRKSVPEKPVQNNEIVRVPIFFSKEDDKDADEDTDESQSSVLERLQSRKAELDGLIKEARADGDEGKVNELRKQRRAVRNKINSLK